MTRGGLKSVEPSVKARDRKVRSKKEKRRTTCLLVGGQKGKDCFAQGLKGQRAVLRGECRGAKEKFGVPIEPRKIRVADFCYSDSSDIF